MKKLVEEFSALSTLELVQKFNGTDVALEKVALRKVISENVEMVELQKLLSGRKISVDEFNPVAEVLRKAGKDGEESKEEAPEKPKETKKTSAKEKTKKEKTKEDAPAKPKVKADKPKPKGKGVIVAIMDILSDTKNPLTFAEIHSRLVKKFPERDETGMMNTIRVQVGGKKRPSRMEKERGIKIEVSDKKGSPAFQIKTKAK